MNKEKKTQSTSENNENRARIVEKLLIKKIENIILDKDLIVALVDVVVVDYTASSIAILTYSMPKLKKKAKNGHREEQVSNSSYQIPPK